MKTSPSFQPTLDAHAQNAVTPVSWFSLLARSTLGVATAESVPTVISTDDAPTTRGPLRLVVQSFPADAPMNNGRPPSHVFPISSAQRRVTAEELRKGIRVELLDTSGRYVSSDAQVIAWVETGDADLAFDGRTARPSHRSLLGTARASGGPVRIRLRKDAA